MIDEAIAAFLLAAFLGVMILIGHLVSRSPLVQCWDCQERGEPRKIGDHEYICAVCGRWWHEQGA